MPSTLKIQINGIAKRERARSNAMDTRATTLAIAVPNPAGTASSARAPGAWPPERGTPSRCSAGCARRGAAGERIHAEVQRGAGHEPPREQAHGDQPQDDLHREDQVRTH